MIKIIGENPLQTKFRLLRFKNTVNFTKINKLKGDYF